MRTLITCVLLGVSINSFANDPRPLDRLFQKDPTASDASAAIVPGGIAVYATLSNPTMYDTYVQSGTSDAGKVALRDGDKPASSITIPSFGSVELKAGGPFVLVSDLTASPKAGDTIKVTLQTDGGAAIAIAATIK